MTTFHLITVLLLGLLIGSFLNVCIYRIPLGRSVVTPPSHCENCGKRIPWHDRIPALSYIFLGGRCRSCKAKISLQYPLVELLNAFLYMLLFWRWGGSVQFAGFALLFSALIVAAFIDYHHSIIPNGINILLLSVGIVYSIFAKDLSYGERFAGFFSVSLILLVLLFLSKGGIGGGDVKLMAVAGIYLGWKLTLLSFFLGSILGSIAAVVLLIGKRKSRKDVIPFGPALAVGIVIAALYGNQWLDWYLGVP